MSDGVRRSRQRTGWRFLPLGLLGALGVVMAVNGVMVFYAVTTFPGDAGPNAFDVSNHYDAVLKAAEQDTGLGWSIAAHAQGTRPVLVVQDRTGAPLPAARVQGEAARPVGAAQTTPLTFLSSGDGVFVANESLPGPGQWTLTLAVTQGERSAAHTMRVTRRLVLP